MLSIIIAIAASLTAQAVETWPRYLEHDTAAVHVAAATRAAAEVGIADAAPVLLAMAYVESRFDPTATSRVVDGKRVTGRWPSRRQAGKGPWFCGVLQAMARFDWPRCLALRDIEAGYLAGARELRAWLKITRGDLFEALNGHGCGMAGLRNECNGYASRVLAWARRLGRAVSS